MATDRSPRAQHGFTLIELLVAMPLALILMAAVFNLVAAAQNSEQRSRERSETLRQEQTDVERMTRELRHATSFQFLTSQKVEFDTWVRSAGTGAMRRVRFDCSSGTACLRYEGAPGAGTLGGPSVLVEGLVHPDVFEPEPDFVNPRYVGIVARVRSGPTGSLITLRDGVDLRNLTPRV